MQRYNPNNYIFTGGPGAGKTTVLNELIRLGYTCVPEVARAIIKSQVLSGGNATHTGDRKAYCELMLNQSILDFINTSATTPCFFDRGIPDLYSYQSQYEKNISPNVLEAIETYRYNRLVFLFPAWEEIYCHDEERKLSFEEAIKTYYSVKESYAICGYQTIEVPKSSINERVRFILKAIS